MQKKEKNEKSGDRLGKKALAPSVDAFGLAFFTLNFTFVASCAPAYLKEFICKGVLESG
jgi:hypothetical protein